jgi:hypothetical protein
MREGQYEIIVLDDRDRPLTEEVISDRSFVTAQPGSSYHVKITVYRNKSGQFPAKYLRLGLYVDGNDVQYWKRLALSDEKTLPKDYSLPICSIFWGLKKNTSEIRSFSLRFIYKENKKNSDNYNFISSVSLIPKWELSRPSGPTVALLSLAPLPRRHRRDD